MLGYSTRVPGPGRQYLGAMHKMALNVVRAQEGNIEGEGHTDSPPGTAHVTTWRMQSRGTTHGGGGGTGLVLVGSCGNRVWVEWKGGEDEGEAAPRECSKDRLGGGGGQGAALGESRDSLQLVKVSGQAMEAEGQQRAQVEGRGWDWQEGALLTPA